MQEYKVLEYVEIEGVGELKEGTVVRLEPEIAKEFVEAGFLAEHKEGAQVGAAASTGQSQPQAKPEAKREASVGLSVSDSGDGVKHDATITQLHEDGTVSVDVVYDKHPEAKPVPKGHVSQGRALGEWDFKG